MENIINVLGAIVLLLMIFALFIMIDEMIRRR